MSEGKRKEQSNEESNFKRRSYTWNGGKMNVDKLNYYCIKHGDNIKTFTSTKNIEKTIIIFIN